MKLDINNSIQLLQRRTTDNKIGSHSTVIPTNTFSKTHRLQHSC